MKWLLTIVFVDSIANNFLIPMIPFMVRRFGVEHIGIATGILASAFNAAQMFGNVCLGRLSDVVGRRPIIVLGLTSSSITLLMLAFATRFETAILLRAVAGAFSATQATARAVVCDRPDKSKRSERFSYLGQAWGAGLLVGPLLSSVGYVPRGTLQPHAPPCIFVSALCALTCGVVLFLDTGRRHNVLRTTSLSRYQKVSDLNTFTSRSGWMRAVADARGLLTLTALTQFVVVGTGEVYVLFASSGLGLNQTEIAASLVPSATVLCVWPLVFIRLERRWGALALFRMGACAFLITTTSLPFVPRDRPVMMWASLCVISAIRGVGGNSCFPSINILINRSTSSNFGAVNGVNGSVGSLSRTVSPIACGSLYTAFASPNPSFALLSVTSVLALACSGAFACPHRLWSSATKRDGSSAVGHARGGGYRRTP